MSYTELGMAVSIMDPHSARGRQRVMDLIYLAGAIASVAVYSWYLYRKAMK